MGPSLPNIRWMQWPKKIARQACKRPVTCLSRGGCQLCAANQVEMIYPHKYLDEMLPFPFLTLVQPDVNVFWVPALLACNVPMGESEENYLHTASAWKAVRQIGFSNKYWRPGVVIATSPPASIVGWYFPVANTLMIAQLQLPPRAQHGDNGKVQSWVL